MKPLNAALLLFLSVLLLSGCASDLQSSGSGSASTSDSAAYNDSSSTGSGGISQDAINSQIATDEANAAAQASYVADMAATQQAISNDSN
jgi:uncharacterized protein YceK